MASALVRFESSTPSPKHHPRALAVPSAAHTGPSDLHIHDPSNFLGQHQPPDSPAQSPIQQSPAALSATSARQRWNNPRKNILRLAVACLIYFANGFNDSVPGALLPYIQAAYGISYATVSTIFVANAAGFIFAAFWVHAMDHALGRARTLMLCEACVVAGYAMMVAPPPFGVFAVGFFVAGFGMAVGLALNNVFAAGTEPAGVVLGYVHGAYGVGGLVAPIVATTAVTHGVRFSYVYLIPLGIRVVNFVFVAWGFWDFERTRPEQDIALVTPAVQRATGVQRRQLLEAIRNTYTSLGALFVFAYQGAEVAISGWVIDFIIFSHGGDPAKVGYVTAGFWGGITLSRFVVTPLLLRWSEKHSVVVLVGLCVVFQLLLWLIPNVVANSVATAILGVLLGPIYPIVTAMFAKLLDRRLQNTSLAFISSAGSSGGALAPFMTGLIAQSTGTWVLSPICIGLYSVMMGCWLVLAYKYDAKHKI